MHILPTVESAPPLPARFEDWVRKTKRKRSLTDAVEELHSFLWNKNGDYRRLLESASNQQAVEGTVSGDRQRAAEMLRNLAEERKDSLVSATQLCGKRGLVRYINGVMARYGYSRRNRSNGHADAA
jgi:hypothetical protein